MILLDFNKTPSSLHPNKQFYLFSINFILENKDNFPHSVEECSVDFSEILNQSVQFRSGGRQSAVCFGMVNVLPPSRGMLVYNYPPGCEFTTRKQFSRVHENG